MVGVIYERFKIIIDRDRLTGFESKFAVVIAKETPGIILSGIASDLSAANEWPLKCLVC